jgi:hypothetical protein
MCWVVMQVRACLLRCVEGQWGCDGRVCMEVRVLYMIDLNYSFLTSLHTHVPMSVLRVVVIAPRDRNCFSLSADRPGCFRLTCSTLRPPPHTRYAVVVVFCVVAVCPGIGARA